MPHLVTFLVFERFGFLDVVGPSDVFTHANQLSGKDLYRLQIAAPRSAVPELSGRRPADVLPSDVLPADAEANKDVGSDTNAASCETGEPLSRHEHPGASGQVTAESGLRLGIDLYLDEVDETDSLVVSGGFGISDLNATTYADVRRLSAVSTRMASVCTGAFVLAHAGLLDGRRATTHWAYASELADQFPNVQVVSDELFVRDGPIVTAAGVAAGIDLALSIVREDHGHSLAKTIAQRMVLYLERSGGQSQFSERLTAVAPLAHEDRIQALLEHVAADPTLDHSTSALAGRAGLSERHLARLFRQQTGTTPTRWVERVRVDSARELLEQTAGSIESVASQSGFGSADTMRQSFQRVLAISPSQYRSSHGQSVSGGRRGRV